MSNPVYLKNGDLVKVNGKLSFLPRVALQIISSPIFKRPCILFTKLGLARWDSLFRGANNAIPTP